MMRDNVLIISNSYPEICYFSRTSTPGPELEMVYKYVDHLVLKYSKLKNKKAVIFIEPQIESGYPDLVILEYYNTPKIGMNSTRNELNIADMKILFYIQTNKSVSINDIVQKLGFSFNEAKKSLYRLKKSKLIKYNEKTEKITHINISYYSRLTKIIAIEAKIDKWAEAIRQANNNIWFSTESYILMNKETCSEQIIELCKSNGTGIILINGKIRKALSSNARHFPVSYASLLFNEWMLRCLGRDNK